MKTEIELMRAALTAIEVWSHRDPETLPIVAELRDAIERAEKQEAVGFREWWDEHVGYGKPHRLANDRRVWTAAQQAERERIRSRAKLAAEKTFKAGGYYVGPQQYLIEQFVDALLEDGDE